MILGPSHDGFLRIVLHTIVAHVVQDGVHIVFVQEVAKTDQIMRVNLHRKDHPICDEARPIFCQVEHLDQ